MKQYGSLLEKVADVFSLEKGSAESEISFKARVLYSMAGRMGYEALWDQDETGNEGYVSVNHIKKRIEAEFQACIELYPECKEIFLASPENLSNEIFSILNDCGFLYHRNYYVAPAPPKSASVGDVTFLRRKQESNLNISGIGSYEKLSKSPAGDIFEMFALSEKTLEERFQKLLECLEMRSMNLPDEIEFLRMTGSFSNGYWVKTSVPKGIISLCRAGERGNYIYFVCQDTDDGVYSSQLPEWMVNEGEYLGIASEILNHYHCLPPIDFQVDGGVCTIRERFLLPNRERAFLKLFSWPASYGESFDDFSRVLVLDVFKSIRSVLEAEGFAFREARG